MNVRIIALLAALVPFVSVHVTYLVAASHGTVDWCNPYLDSCTSISATGRQAPASFIFCSTMLPAAVFMMAYWWLNHTWLAAVHHRAGHHRQRANHWMLGLGVLACIGLILYVTVLGERGQAWAAQRRVGTILFFSFTFIAQLLLLEQLRRLDVPGIRSGSLVYMGSACGTLLATGVLTVILQAWNAAWYETVEDALEWVLTLLLQSNFLAGYFVWRQAGWKLAVKERDGEG